MTLPPTSLTIVFEVPELLDDITCRMDRGIALVSLSVIQVLRISVSI